MKLPLQATAVLMSACYAMALFQRTAFHALDGPLRQEFALSAVASADLAAVFFWTYLAVSIPVGVLTDVLGSRRMAVAGSFLVAAGSLLFAQADSYAMLALARGVIAAGSAAAFIGLMRFVAMAFPDRKATYSGRGIMAGNVGALVSGAPLVMLLALAPWRSLWLGTALVSVLLAVAMWLGKGDSRHTEPVRAMRQTLPGELRTLFTSRHVYLGVLLLGGLAGAFYAFGNLIGPRWLAERGFAPLEVGWLVSALVAGYALGAASWGWLGDRERQRTLALFVATALALACWCAFAMLPLRSTLAVGLLVVVSGWCCGAFTLTYPLIAEHYPTSQAGGVIAFVNCGIPMGAALAQSIAGRLPDAAGVWVLVGASAVAVIAAARLLWERQARDELSAKLQLPLGAAVQRSVEMRGLGAVRGAGQANS